MTRQEVIGVVYIVLVYAIVFFVWHALYVSVSIANTEKKDFVARLDTYPGSLFTCTQGKALKALFTAGAVNLSLSDGRRINLPQAVSASGARYANPDESFVFWNKGKGAFIEEYGKTTYAGCITAD